MLAWIAIGTARAAEIEAAFSGRFGLAEVVGSLWIFGMLAVVSRGKA